MIPKELLNMPIYDRNTRSNINMLFPTSQQITGTDARIAYKVFRESQDKLEKAGIQNDWQEVETFEDFIQARDITITQDNIRQDLRPGHIA